MQTKEVDLSRRDMKPPVMKQNKDNDNIMVVTNNDVDTSRNSEGGSSMVMNDIKKNRSGDEKAPLGEQPAADIRKTTFSVGGGTSSVRDTIRKHEALVWVFSNGRCMTHYVKLEKIVKNKKYSVVGTTGNIEWRYHDVT